MLLVNINIRNQLSLSALKKQKIDKIYEIIVFRYYTSEFWSYRKAEVMRRILIVNPGKGTTQSPVVWRSWIQRDWNLERLKQLAFVVRLLNRRELHIEKAPESKYLLEYWSAHMWDKIAWDSRNKNQETFRLNNLWRSHKYENILYSSKKNPNTWGIENNFQRFIYRGYIYIYVFFTLYKTKKIVNW